MICLLYIQIEVTAGLEFNLKFILYGSLMTPPEWLLCIWLGLCPLWRHSTVYECGASSDYKVILFSVTVVFVWFYVKLRQLKCSISW